MKFLKLLVAEIRWGNLTEDDKQLVINSPLKKVFFASYIRRSIISPRTISTLD